jgi:hypothetical protein
MSDAKPVDIANAPMERPPEPRAQSRLPYLTAALLLGIVVLLRLVPNDPALLRSFEKLGEPYRQMQRQRYLTSLTRNDPALGTRLLSPGNAPLRAAVAARGRGSQTVLVFIGPCSGCVMHDLVEWKRLAEQDPRRAVIFVSRDSPEQIARFVRSQRFSLPVLADPEGTLATRVNAVWVPRAYAVTRDGTLTWIQPNDGMEAEACARRVWPEPAR